MERNEATLAPEQALNDIRGMMAKSSRFLSLSGWSGVWAGCVALCASFIAAKLLPLPPFFYGTGAEGHYEKTELFGDHAMIRLITLAAITFIVAFAGSYFFTARKAKAQGQKIWNSTSRRLMLSVMLPMLAGGIFCLSFLLDGALSYIAPACLTFYGLALINGSKYTLGEIRWLGYCEVMLGCLCLAIPGLGLALLAAGFGVLHILYGIFMWNKYDKHAVA